MMVKMGLSVRKSNDDGIPSQAYAHAGTDRAAVSPV